MFWKWMEMNSHPIVQSGNLFFLYYNELMARLWSFSKIIVTTYKHFTL